MNLLAECEVVLSKKLEKIFEKGEPISIYIAPFRSNRSRAQIRFSAPDGTNIEEVKALGDTSLLFRFIDVGHDAPNLTNDKPVQSLFATQVENQDVEVDAEAPQQDNVVAKITSGTAERVAKAQANATVRKLPVQPPAPPQPQQPVAPPQPPPPPAPPQKQRIVLRTHEDLVNLLSRLPGVDKEMPQINEGKRLDRDSAIRYEKQLRQMTRLPFSLYARNNLKGKLEIQDLNTIMKPGEVWDLSSVPARQLIMSRDFRICMESKYISFASKDDYLAWQKDYSERVQNLTGEARAVGDRGLQAYGSASAAAEALYTSDKGSSIEDGGASKFITKEQLAAKVAAKTALRAGRFPAPSQAQEIKGEVVDFTEELQNPEAEVTDDLSKWVDDPTVKSMLSQFPDERAPGQELPKTIHPPSKSHKPIRRVGEDDEEIT